MGEFEPYMQEIQSYLSKVRNGRRVAAPDPRAPQFSQRADDLRLMQQGSAPAGYGSSTPPKYREEDTETIPAGQGWRNIEGPRSGRAGMPVNKYYPFEKTQYPNLQEALGSAITRAAIQAHADNKTTFNPPDDRYASAIPQYRDPEFIEAPRGKDPMGGHGISHSYKPPPAAETFGLLMEILNDPRNAWMGLPKILGTPAAMVGMLKGVKGMLPAERAGLEDAQKLAKEGRPLETWKETQWEQGPGGDWFRNIEGPSPTFDRSQSHKWELQKFYHDPGLFEAYPRLAKTSVRPLTPEMQGGQPGMRAAFDIKNRNIYVNPKYLAEAPDDKIRESLSHELQHAVQSIENAPSGGTMIEFLPEGHRLRTAILGPKMQQLYTQLQQQIGRPIPVDDFNHLIHLQSGLPLKAGHGPQEMFAPGPEREAYLRQLFDELSSAHGGFKPMMHAAADIQRAEQDAWRKYSTTAGEVQARDAGKRAVHMTPEERRRIAPHESQDTAYANQWVRRPDERLKAADPRTSALMDAIFKVTSPHHGTYYASDRAGADKIVADMRKNSSTSNLDDQRIRPRIIDMDAPGYREKEKARLIKKYGEQTYHQLFGKKE